MIPHGFTLKSFGAIYADLCKQQDGQNYAKLDFGLVRELIHLSSFWIANAATTGMVQSFVMKQPLGPLLSCSQKQGQTGDKQTISLSIALQTSPCSSHGFALEDFESHTIPVALEGIQDALARTGHYRHKLWRNL